MPDPAIGLSSRIVATLAYAFGFVSGVVILIVEREDRYVRFHAMQSTLTFLAVLVGSLVIGSLPVFGRLLNGVLSVGVGGLWFFLMFKASTGERYQLPYVGDVAERQIR